MRRYVKISVRFMGISNKVPRHLIYSNMPDTELNINNCGKVK